MTKAGRRSRSSTPIGPAMQGSVVWSGCLSRRRHAFGPLSYWSQGGKVDTGSSEGGRHWPARFLVVLVVAAAASAAAEQQLRLGSVMLKLGETDAVVMDELSKQYKVQRIEGGWSIQPLERSGRTPGIGVRTTGGRIRGVSFLWGPGFTPPVEEMAEQLAQALPAGAQCEVRSVTRPQEGGTVRTLEWLCGSYKVRLVTGVWPQGNTASISIDKQ